MQESLQVIENALVDRTVCGATPLTTFQFERVGYFCVDLESSANKVHCVRVLALGYLSKQANHFV